MRRLVISGIALLATAACLTLAPLWFASAHAADGDAKGAAAAAPMTFDLTAASSDAAAGFLALSGTQTTMAINGQPGSRTRWVLAYGTDVLASGAVALDDRGRGSVVLDLPSVRTRTLCTVTVSTEKTRARRELTVLPQNMLEDARAELERLRVGVIDPSGNIVAALKAEGVASESLDTDLQRDFFMGGMVILAGFADCATLSEECRRLRSRVDDGMIALVVAPPAGWREFDMSCVAMPMPGSGPLLLAGNAGRCLSTEDVGDGPWPAYLECGRDARPLVRFQFVPDSTPPLLSCPESRAVLAGAACGKGVAVAAALPQLNDPAHDPVGRCALNEMITWSLAERRALELKEDKP